MSERKMVDDYKKEIQIHLAAIKVSGKIRPDFTAIKGLCEIYELTVGDKCCMSCSRHLGKVLKYFTSYAKRIW